MFSSKCFLPSVSLRMAVEKEKWRVHAGVQPTHPWAESRETICYQGRFHLGKRDSSEKEKTESFRQMRLSRLCLPGRDVLESREGRKMPSEHNVDSPLITINTVCGRSREIANPKALRYLFSWSRLESSCSLENKSGSREWDKYLVGGKKLSTESSRFGNNSVQSFNAKKLMVLANECLGALIVQIITLAHSRAPWATQCWLKQEKVKVGSGGLTLLILAVHKKETNQLSRWQYYSKALQELKINYKEETTVPWQPLNS